MAERVRSFFQKPPAVGDRIEMIAMADDPYPVPAGTLGTVTGVHLLEEGHVWQATVDWDNGRRLALVERDTYALIVEEVER